MASLAWMGLIAIGIAIALVLFLLVRYIESGDMEDDE